MEISNQREVIWKKRITTFLLSMFWNLNLRTYILVNMLLQIFWKIRYPCKTILFEYSVLLFVFTFEILNLQSYNKPV